MPGVDRDLQGRHERLGDPEGDRLAVPSGSGSLAISSSRWFCQKQSPHATTSTAAETMMRLRSSSRCSTSVSWSSKLAALSRATGSAQLGGRLRPRPRRARRRPRRPRSAGASAASSSASSSSSSLPEIEALNSRMPLPTERPSSGRRFGPKMIRAMIRTTRISGGPILLASLRMVPARGPRHRKPA